jgi:hypothetical protein
MSVPPPPPSGPPSGGFFGGPVQPPVSQYGYAAPAPDVAGYGPAATFGTPPVAQRPAAGPRTPELVTVSCTLLGVFAAVGVFTVIVVLVLSSYNDSSASSDGGVSLTNIGLGAIYGVLWGGSGFINAAMIVLLRQGNAMARVITSVICGLWTLYWFKLLWDLGNVSAGESFGSIVHLGELFLLGLAVASALPAVLLWRPSASSHFS